MAPLFLFNTDVLKNHSDCPVKGQRRNQDYRYVTMVVQFSAKKYLVYFQLLLKLYWNKYGGGLFLSNVVNVGKVGDVGTLEHKLKHLTLFSTEIQKACTA